MINNFILILGFLIIKFLILFVLPYLIFWKVLTNYFKNFKIQLTERKSPVALFEFKYSVLTVVIQSIFFFAFYNLNELNFFHIYSGFGSRGYLNELYAFIVYFLLYDTYFYWSHRLLHQGWLYKNVHSIHHHSLNPTPLAAYSFHPIEAIMSMLYFLPFLYFVPLSIEMLLVLILITDFGNLAGHLGYEFLPRSMWKSRWGSWLTTPTHHNLHHQLSKCNYALYWRGWDQIFNTLHSKTESEFYKIKDQV